MGRVQVRAKIDAKPDNWQLVLPRAEDFIKVTPPPVTFKTEEQWGQLKLTMDPSGVQYNNRPDVDPDNKRWMDLKAACEGALQWDRELKTWYARGKQKKCMKVCNIIKKVQQLSLAQAHSVLCLGICKSMAGSEAEAVEVSCCFNVITLWKSTKF